MWAHECGGGAVGEGGSGLCTECEPHAGLSLTALRSWVSKVRFSYRVGASFQDAKKKTCFFHEDIMKLFPSRSSRITFLRWKRPGALALCHSPSAWAKESKEHNPRLQTMAPWYLLELEALLSSSSELFKRRPHLPLVVEAYAPSGANLPELVFPRRSKSSVLVRRGS